MFEIAGVRFLSRVKINIYNTIQIIGKDAGNTVQLFEIEPGG